MPIFKYAIASFYLFPNPPTNGLTPYGNNDPIVFIMFALMFPVFLNNYFFIAGKNSSGYMRIIPLEFKYLVKYFLLIL